MLQISDETRKYIEEEEQIRFAIRQKLEAKTREEMALRAAHTQWARTGFSIMIFNLILAIFAASSASNALLSTSSISTGIFGIASFATTIFGGFTVFGFFIWAYNSSLARPS